jgi:hypothetical protein
MSHFSITQLLAGAALASVAACNGQLAIDDLPDGGYAGYGGYATAGHTGVTPSDAGQASGGHAGAILPRPSENDPPSDVSTRSSAANADDCPTSMPDDQSPCDVAEGQYCTYLYALDPADPESTMAQSCGCWLANGGTTRWDCGSAQAAYLCPDAEPQEGADCFGSLGVHCHYPPAELCDCAPTAPHADTMTWQCESTALDRGSAAGPAGLDPTTPVAALTDTQRAAWCDWYSDAWHGPGAPDVPDHVDASGYTTLSGAAAGSRPECLACMPGVSKAGCAANLALSSCEAPVGALSDCVITVLDLCVPSPHGCAPYFDSPNCDGTIAVSRLGGDGATSDPCSIRVQ